MPIDPVIPPTSANSQPSPDWEALARYLAGESSPAESARIAEWLAEHKADAELLGALDNAMAGLALQDPSEVDVEAALNRVTALREMPVTAETALSRRPTRVRELPRRRMSPWFPVSLLAAAAAVIFAARVVLQSNRGSESVASRSGLTGGARTFASGVGKLDSVQLPDGGRVILGPSSHLIVAAGYGERGREVELHGEAYFDVVHDATRPFVVHTGNATIRDIGTSFAARGDIDRPVQVVVTSGSVTLRANAGPDSGAVLTAGAIGTLQPTGQVVVRRDASMAPYLAWMRDSLVFRDASLQEVSSDLQRWYGVVLRVGDTSLTRRHLTMTFSGDSLDRVLRVIGLGLGADIERRGDTVVVRSSARSVRPQ